MFQQMIRLIQELEADDTIKYQEFLTDSPEFNSTHFEIALCNLFINQNGSANLRMIREFNTTGYTISCGEKDSFGWLTGILHTKKGKIVYG